jgi:hypothetical protein
MDISQASLTTNVGVSVQNNFQENSTCLQNAGITCVKRPQQSLGKHDHINTNGSSSHSSKNTEILHTQERDRRAQSNKSVHTGPDQ